MYVAQPNSMERTRAVAWVIPRARIQRRPPPPAEGKFAIPTLH